MLYELVSLVPLRVISCDGIQQVKFVGDRIRDAVEILADFLFFQNCKAAEQCAAGYEIQSSPQSDERCSENQ